MSAQTECAKCGGPWRNGQCYGECRKAYMRDYHLRRKEAREAAARTIPSFVISLPPMIPCGRSIGTVAPRPNGVTRCTCGEIHAPAQVVFEATYL